MFYYSNYQWTKRTKKIKRITRIKRRENMDGKYKIGHTHTHITRRYSRLIVYYIVTSLVIKKIVSIQIKLIPSNTSPHEKTDDENESRVNSTECVCVCVCMPARARVCVCEYECIRKVNSSHRKWHLSNYTHSHNIHRHFFFIIARFEIEPHFIDKHYILILDVQQNLSTSIKKFKGIVYYTL